MSLADKIHYLMLQTGISQIELAKKTSIERSTITKILNGSTLTPKLETIFTLAKFFQVDVEDLLTDRDNKQKYPANIPLKTILTELMDAYKIPNAYTLHQKTGIPANALGDILSGKTINPKIKTLQVLSEFFNISIPQLCGLDPLPSKDTLLPVNNAKSFRLPLLSLEQIELFLEGNFHSTNYISTTLSQTNEKQYAIEVAESIYFPAILPGNIIVLDITVAPEKNDYVLGKTIEGIEIYKFIEKQDSSIRLHRISADELLEFTDSQISLLGTVIQQIINRNRS